MDSLQDQPLLDLILKFHEAMSNLAVSVIKHSCEKKKLIKRSILYNSEKLNNCGSFTQGVYGLMEKKDIK